MIVVRPTRHAVFCGQSQARHWLVRLGVSRVPVCGLGARARVFVWCIGAWGVYFIQLVPSSVVAPACLPLHLCVFVFTGCGLLLGLSFSSTHPPYFIDIGRFSTDATACLVVYDMLSASHPLLLDSCQQWERLCASTGILKKTHKCNVLNLFRNYVSRCWSRKYYDQAIYIMI